MASIRSGTFQQRQSNRADGLFRNTSDEDLASLPMNCIEQVAARIELILSRRPSNHTSLLGM